MVWSNARTVVIITVERDLSRLRFLCTRVQKGEHLYSEDIMFLLEQRAKLQYIVNGIVETLDILREKDSLL